MNDRLDHKIKAIINNLRESDVDNAAALYVSIISVAARYFTYSDGGVDDFCVQKFDGDGIVFGGTNRLIWSPARGFVPDRSACTEAFLAHYARLGALPGMAHL